MRTFLQKPTLGGRLAILNLVLWVAIAILGRQQWLPYWIEGWIVIVLSLPLAIWWECLLPSTTPVGTTIGLVVVVISLAINAFAWGHGVSWIWHSLVNGVRSIAADPPMK